MNDPGSKRRLHAYLTGRVQGVGMRATVAFLATDHRLTGWVRNLNDGRVEMVAEGQEAEIERCLEALRQRMGSYIEKVERNWMPATGDFRAFDVRY